MPANTTLDDILNFTGDKEPLPQWTWYVESFPSIGGVTIDPKYVIQTSLPLPKFSPRTKVIAATSVTSAGMSEVDAFDITFREDQKVRSLKYITAWQNNVQNPYTGGYYLPTRYKKEISMVLTDIKGVPILRAKMRNIWPTTIQQWTLDSASEFRNLEVNFACDAVELEFP